MNVIPTTKANGQRGFTLVETFVAITVLLVAIVGPMTIAARGLQSAFFAKEQITAFYMAQEAIEYVRWNRDNFALQNVGSGGSTGFFSSIPAQCNGTPGPTGGCGVTSRDFNGGYRNCDSVQCRVDFDDSGLDADRGFHTHGVGDPTPFTRRMWINEITPDQEMEVIVWIEWDTGLFSTTRTVEVKSTIFNHYDDV